MDKTLARSFLMMVNDKPFMDELQRYANHRIEYLKDQLSIAELDRIKSLQGQITELKRFSTLRDEVVQKSTGEP